MAEEIDAAALLTKVEAEALKKVIGQRLHYGKQYWWPLHARMDYWMSMYLMLDVIQQMKPVGYRRFITNEPRCVTPETRVLTADARWVPAGDLHVGQQLMAFEDEPTHKQGTNSRGLRARHYRRSIVTHKEFKVAPVYKITLADGRTVRCTGEHKWLARVATERGAIKWISTEEMARHYARRDTSYPGKHGDNAGRMWLSQYFEPWGDGVEDRDSGYLAGAFDADGSVYRKTSANHYPMIQFTQCDNACLHEVFAALTRKGFSYNFSISIDKRGRQPLHHVYLNGGRSEILRFLGQIRPPRLLERFSAMKIEDVELRASGTAEIVSVEPDGDAPIVALTSSSGTYHTEYGASHNTAVDSAVSIMTRNDSFWRIDLMVDEVENQERRRGVGKVERMLQGIIYDADELFSMRGLLPFWKQVAYQALLRGAIWGKAHITSSVLDYRPSPLMTEIFDARLVYPHFDQYGLNHVSIEKHTTLGDLISVYPEQYQQELKSADCNPSRPAIKIEYWSNTRGEEEGLTGCLAVIADPNTMTVLTQPLLNMDTMGKAGKWVIPPYRHGYSPEELPVVGVPVNGLPVQMKPGYSPSIASAYETRSQLFGFDMRLWHGPNTTIAEWGRSILSSVEEQIPQFNELVATIFQHFSISAFGQFLIRTQTGEGLEFDSGIEARIPLRPEESIERLEVAPITVDAYRLLDILRNEQAQGTLSGILRASVPFAGESGILFQQQINTALNGLEPYRSGAEQFGTRLSGALVAQMQRLGSDLKKFKFSVPLRPNTYFRIDEDFDPATELAEGRKYRARPIFRPALPDDMHIRIQTAKIAIDPARPVLSLLTVLEQIIRVEDPMAEIDRIWEDVANRDPVIVLEQIALALDRIEGEGNPISERIREAEFKTRFIEDLQWRQMSGQQGNGQSPQLSSESGAPGSTTRTSTEADQQQRALATEGQQLMSSIGQ